MIKEKHIICCFLLLLSGCGLTEAQELRGLSENPQVKKGIMNAAPLILKSSAVNTLPFFEDFSSSDIFPDINKWADNDVFINNSFPVDPVSSGVATFDAVDANGDIYAAGDMPVSSDKLTSWPFNLASYATGTDTVILSFYYQVAGKGESPEFGDSLLLEFYSPAQDQWIRAWFADKDEFSDFEQVIVKIPHSFYQNGFRFRFRNYTSMPASGTTSGKGALSNVDFWNVDYIMMNTKPVQDHMSVSDVTLTEPPRYLMDFYESVPWDHLNSAQGITRNMLHYAIRNLETEGDSLNIGRSYYVRNYQTGSAEYAEILYSKFGPNSLTRKDDPFFAPFTRSGNALEGTFKAAAYIVTPANDYKGNDTAVTMLHFKDYYAYDDGIPEYGFGIPGESTYGALLAYRFRIYKPDTLKAFDIMFNKTRDGVLSDEKFRLCVWDEKEGKPGDVIFLSDEEYYPVYANYPGFSRFPLNTDRELVINDSVVYIGFVQLTEEFLNIGYDVNRDNISRIFVNLSGNWFNPAALKPGSLMMRPVFSTTAGPFSGTPEIPGEADGISVYPNPARDILFINALNDAVRRIEVFDMSGRLLYEKDYPALQTDVSGLPPGIYHFRIFTSGGVTENRKVIISR
jgi:hypothetical protein